MRYILGALAFILVIFLVIALAFGRGTNSKTTQSNVTVKAVVSYADKNSDVSQTTIGRMVGEESRRAIRIIVSPNERRLEILSGYDESVMTSQSYPNTRTAYSNFLSALGNTGFTASRKSTITDPRGICPTGNRYIYDLSQDGEHVSNLWAASCEIPGTFAGRGAVIRQLFQKQIPAYETQIRTVQL